MLNEAGDEACESPKMSDDQDEKKMLKKSSQETKNVLLKIK